MDSAKFYLDLKSYDDFQQITNSEHCKSVPDDWAVFITDVKGSTKAIEAGRYKDVNTIGAASIVCAQNAMPGVDFPYVFGGDGATMLIPPEHIESVKKELVALKSLSESQFNLQLRVGMIMMSEVKAAGGEVLVSKYEFVTNRYLAIFRGGGLTVAEEKIKKENEKYEVNLDIDVPANLDGLSCRWQPIPNKRGHILSFLVAAREVNKLDVYGDILTKMNEIMGGKLEDANPVNLENLTYKSVQQCVDDEKRYQQKGFFARFVEILIAVWIFKLKLPNWGFDAKHYKKSLRAHSDYRKFDDMLRMIIDCSDEQYDQIDKYLKDLHDQGIIFYGLFTASNALMTCYVEGLTDGNHIHFIDGGNGGYAMAAKQLKQQIQEASNEERAKAA